MKKKIYSIGIDVSKKTLDVCLLGKEHSVLKEINISNTAEGITKLDQILTEYSMHNKASILMESTSSYHLLPALLLLEKEYRVKVFNPIINKKYSGGSIRKCKTDKIDAKRIAEIGLLEKIPYFQTTKESVILKRKVSILQTFLGQKQVMKASLRHLKEDCDNLKVSTGSSYPSMEEALLKLSESIKKLEKEIQAEGSNIKGYKLISKIKGLSERSTSIILSHVGDKEFHSKNAMVAYVGLDVSVKQSGTSVMGRGRISKRGNTMLRKTLTQAAWGLRMHNKKFQELAEYHKKKGKHYFEIMVILARKLIHIIFGILKNNSRFNPAKIVIPEHSS